MSRMNDLDDISLTDPLPLNRSNSNQGSAGSRAGKCSVLLFVRALKPLTQGC